MLRVLIVDDAIFMRISIKNMLERNGFEIAGEAVNGKDAILKAKELKPDLITMDITMPEMDGVTAVKEIVRENKNVKICMVSAMGQEKMITDAIIAGASSFLVKPFNEEKVVATLKTMAGYR